MLEKRPQGDQQFIWPGYPENRHCLKLKRKSQTESGVFRETKERDNRGSSDPRLICASCHHPITSRENRVEKLGAHEHTFANPSGMIFHIGCFSGAPGTLRDREEYAEFSWFAGHSWSFVACSLCGTHLGWFFHGRSSSFYGLILDRLIEMEQKAN